MAEQLDAELEEFRRVMEVPSSFLEGFNWTSLFGAIFIALLMVPGSVYMGLLAGQGIGGAAQWVTVILFVEVAKRAHKNLNKSEVYVLFFMSAAAMGQPFSGLLWNQFFARSDAVVAYGIANDLPRWVAPPAGSESYSLRSFFHADWFPVIAMVLFGTFSGQLASIVLGYGLFRVTSDIERLPFPMAPVGAQGIMALAEDEDVTDANNNESSWSRRVFSIGGALGLAWGAIYLLLPTLSNALTDETIQIFPIPFFDATPKTGGYLKAVATGLCWDMGNLLGGMVMPFFAMLGSFIGLIITFIANPILYKFRILRNWSAGDDTIQTIFKNNIDFYFSFGIGISLAIAVIGLYKVYHSVREARAQRKEKPGLNDFAAPKGRGDISPWMIVTVYFIITITYITVSAALLRWHDGQWHKGMIVVMLLLGFVYTPIISYVTARFEGMIGMAVSIPMIREASILLSGYRGVACWFVPIPISNYGSLATGYRTSELTGTKFTSMWKATIILTPIILVSSIFFMNFLWGLNPVPSSAYPYAEKMWPLEAAGSCIMMTSTMGEYSMFQESFNAIYLAVGTVFGVVLFSAMRWVGAPILLAYGVIGGMGTTLPHSVIPQFIGALIGRYYFKKRLGIKWRQYVPVVTAGFGCGVGLIVTLGVGITFLKKAVIQIPY